MTRTHEVAGRIMYELEAFDKSRPSIDSPQILIVRGMSKKRVDHQEMPSLLSDLMKRLGARRVEIISEEAGDIIGAMDEGIRACVDVNAETDVQGIMRMKESFEGMNCHVEYGMGVLGKIALFIILWKDKSGMGPMFVELVVSNRAA